ncbi:hypothetical protein [Massilia scottii]|uniref:hypothetical protein n=1 Tax=Massilia scottii TaxID=3057166 RepID=UPI002796C243|nr:MULTISPECIES: hypothetical protein [unclassified Massilia]MDQ1817280.1 hypothetical protein [Massilia sp. CCM 9210]MDQ1835341.1 hypothetical protein [Massilia sp. CCM 9029]
MTRLFKFVSLSVFLVSTCCVAESAERAALLGEWKCGPYTMAGPELTITVEQTSNYSNDSKFWAIAEVDIRLTNGKVIKTRNRASGNWSLKNRIIEIHYDNVEFLSSGDPSLTVAMGQAALDAQQKKRNWARFKVLELGKRFVSVPLEVINKAAEVEVICIRP